MAQIDQIRNSIIDKLLTINNPEILSAFDKILETRSDSSITIDESQKKMLEKSDLDIKNGNVISQEDLNKQDSEWLD